MRKENFWNFLGMLLGLAVIFVGISTMKEPVMGGFYGTSGTYLQGESANHVTFGADYYTYEYKATRIAGENAQIAAYNISQLGEDMSSNFTRLGRSFDTLGTALAKYFGTIFVIVGCIIFLVYAKKFFCLPKQPAVIAAGAATIPSAELPPLEAHDEAAPQNF